MLAEEKGDIFQKRAEGNWVIIPTNGTVKKDGTCVMGRGLALAVKEMYPEFPAMLGVNLENEGNQVYVFPDYGIITFPVKHNWWEEADLELIAKSALELRMCITKYFRESKQMLYIPRVGCGNGKKTWAEVKPILEKELEFISDRVVVIYQEDENART